jgi:hypothetical protein
MMQKRKTNKRKKESMGEGVRAASRNMRWGEEERDGEKAIRGI